ncbi:MAG TPA: Stp1/IreP family PP2C-type Ser/Thr phosphatase [Tissierellaceae bacterium]|nr:Stp1/IreP family PP2C-type Ser/Thr phosphatase [Tissierellaceae bacterium]
MKVYGLTDNGLSRENNQDSLFVSDSEDLPLFMVADGMGGHNAGEIASNIAVDTIKNNFYKKKKNLESKVRIIDTIGESIYEANKKVYLEAIRRPNCSGMGTTLTMAYIFDNNIYIGHIGDSRAYHIRDNNIMQITEDDSLVNELIKNGSITKEEAMNHPQKNVITKALGTSIDIEIDVQTKEYEDGDFLVICSDGLSNMVKEKDILKTIRIEKDVKSACETLVDHAKKNGGLDNITLIIIEFQ